MVQAVFPLCIAHQTITAVAAPCLARQALPQALQAVMPVALTALGCVLRCLPVRRVPILATRMGVDRASARSAIIRPS